MGLCRKDYEQALIDAGVLDPLDLKGCKKDKQRAAVMARAQEEARKQKLKIKAPPINRGRLYKEWCEHRDSHQNTYHHSQVAAYPIERVVQAYKDWWKKKGGRAGPPKLHGTSTSASFTLQLSRTSWTDKSIRVPGMGEIRCRENPAERIAPGKPCSVTVTCTANEWYASIAMKDIPYDGVVGDGIVGLDIGIGSSVTTSDGEQFPPPRPLDKALRRLAMLSRRLQRTQSGSRRRTLARLRVAKLHARVANIRADHLHNMSTSLAEKYAKVVVEGFDVVSLVSVVGQRRTRRAIADLGWGEFRRQLTYKLEWRGGQAMVTDRLHPTNRECAKCGELNECPPTQKKYHCAACDWTTTRQNNTAQLLAKMGAE